MTQTRTKATKEAQVSKAKETLRQQLLRVLGDEPTLPAVFNDFKDNRKPPWITVEYDQLDPDAGTADLAVNLYCSRADSTHPEDPIDEHLATILPLIEYHTKGIVIGGNSQFVAINKGAPFRTFVINVHDSQAIW